LVQISENPKSDFPSVDAIINTAIYFFERRGLCTEYLYRFFLRDLNCFLQVNHRRASRTYRDTNNGFAGRFGVAIVDEFQLKTRRIHCRLLHRFTVARINQGSVRTREAKRSSYSEPLRIYNNSVELLDRDDSEAFRLNHLAAQAGNHDAVLAMGWFYLNGVGVEADERAAVLWYRKSARQGDPKAMFSLGQIAYLRGEFAEALTCFERAAGKGHQRSNFWIGKMYWRGNGVAKNQKVAKNYFARAASGKVQEAKRTLRYLAFRSDRTRQQST
jgi:tetratricopeptide (TPR) repeat protein